MTFAVSFDLFVCAPQYATARMRGSILCARPSVLKSVDAAADNSVEALELLRRTKRFQDYVGTFPRSALVDG